MKVLVLLVVGISAASALVYCPPDACDRMECAPLTKWDCGVDRFEEKGGMCQCCPVCIKQLKYGDDCSALRLLGAPPTVECAGNLRCDSKSWTCKYRCHEEESLFQAIPQPPLGAFRPRCDADGSYSPYQCQGSQCYCVAKDGTKIKGYTVSRWQTRGMNCKCARDQYAYMKLKLLGKMFKCKSNGNYDIVQCVGSQCHCVDEDGRSLKNSPWVPISNTRGLRNRCLQLLQVSHRRFSQLVQRALNVY